MTGFEKVIYFLNQIQMERPTPWGWFHLMSIGIGLLVLVYLRLTKKRDNDKRCENVLFIFGLVSFVLELIKQVMWSYSCSDGTWNYQWWSFPFQFCTTPLIVCLLYKFIKNENFREHIRAYLGFFTIVASIAVMFNPDSCFTKYVEVNVYTMFLHMGGFVISMYVLLGGFIDFNLKSYVKGYKVFVVFVIIALILNISIYNSGILHGETLNLFYISPYFETTLPVFNVVQAGFPYVVFLTTYLFAFFLGGLIILGLTKLFTIKKK